MKTKIIKEIYKNFNELNEGEKNKIVEENFTNEYVENKEYWEWEYFINDVKKEILNNIIFSNIVEDGYTCYSKYYYTIDIKDMNLYNDEIINFIEEKKYKKEDVKLIEELLYEKDLYIYWEYNNSSAPFINDLYTNYKLNKEEEELLEKLCKDIKKYIKGIEEELNNKVDELEDYLLSNEYENYLKEILLEELEEENELYLIEIEEIKED